MTTNKITSLKYTDAQLAEAFKKSANKVFDSMESKSKVSESERNFKIACALRGVRAAK
jgi:hypothetical protein